MARSSVRGSARRGRGASGTIRTHGDRGGTGVNSGHRPLHVVFVGAAPLGPMAAICFKALALKSRATAVFAARARRVPEKAGHQGAASSAVEAMMNEVGVHRWKTLRRGLDAALVWQADLVVTLARANQARAPKLPAVPGRIEQWTLPPMSGDENASTRARRLRDAVRTRVAMLVFMEGWGRPELTRAEERVARPTAAEGHHPFVPMSPFLVQSHAHHPS